MCAERYAPVRIAATAGNRRRKPSGGFPAARNGCATRSGQIVSRDGAPFAVLYQRMRTLIVVAVLTACACGPASQAGVPEYGYDVVHAYPHDRTAFTEGLFFLNGFLYEATGLEGSSSVRKVKLETEIGRAHV